MTEILRKRQHCAPMLIDRLDEAPTVRTLEHVPFRQDKAGDAHDEAWLQKLIHRCPELLPIGEIEPGFGSLVPICMELPTSAGPVDNLFMTPEGNLVLAECKLWRNPEARRQVVAQIMDYAQAMAGWTYEDLSDAVGRSSHGVSSIYEAVSIDTDLDEDRFVDAVTRNLSLGRVHLMIVGDGIRSNAEKLANSLQRHPGFHFSLSMVEMPIFRLPDDSYIVTPRILVRTVNIERGVVSVVEGSIRFHEPEESSDAGNVARSTISVEQGLEQLRAASEETANLLETFVENAKDRGVYLDAATKSLVIRWAGPDDQNYALASIAPGGKLITGNVGWVPKITGHVELAHDYLRALAGLIGCRVRQTPTAENWSVIGPNGKAPDVLSLLRKSDEWHAIMDEYIGTLERALRQI